MYKVIYILCVGHSGSTLLDLLLSKHDSILGLGEVYGLFIGKSRNAEGTSSVCSCGQNLDACSFWGEYTGRVKDISERDIARKYRAMLDLAGQHGKHVVVDSSKKLWMMEYLLSLAEKKEIDLKVLFLIRDARGWAVSASRLGRKTGKARKPPFYHIIRWYIRNRRIATFLRAHNIDHLEVSYEQLSFNTERTVRKVLDYVQVGQEGFLPANLANTHIVYGNRMKKGGETSVVYDHEWMGRFWVNASLALLTPIFMWNRKHVKLCE